MLHFHLTCITYDSLYSSNISKQPVAFNSVPLIHLHLNDYDVL